MTADVEIKEMFDSLCDSINTCPVADYDGGKCAIALYGASEFECPEDQGLHWRIIDQTDEDRENEDCFEDWDNWPFHHGATIALANKEEGHIVFLGMTHEFDMGWDISINFYDPLSRSVLRRILAATKHIQQEGEQ